MSKQPKKEPVLQDIEQYRIQMVGIVRTVGGYPDDSTHTVEWLVKHKELRDGDKLYASPQTRNPEPEQKPVAWMYHGILHNGTPHDRPSLILRPEYMDAMSAKMGAKATPLYTAPPQRKPLTDERIDAAWRSVDYTQSYENFRIAIARAIERAHGIGGE